MTRQIVSAGPQYATAIADLMDEMDLFYGATAPETRAERLQQINEFLFTGPGAPIVLLATSDEEAIAMASCSILWPAADTTRSLYLKELYVRQTWRGKNVGTELMQAVFNQAKTLRCSRVEWTTDTDNDDAVQFYNKIGVDPYQGKIFYRRSLEDV